MIKKKRLRDNYRAGQTNIRKWAPTKRNAPSSTQPYKTRRFFDGVDVQWLVVSSELNNKLSREYIISSHPTSQEAEDEAARHLKK